MNNNDNKEFGQVDNSGNPYQPQPPVYGQTGVPSTPPQHPQQSYLVTPTPSYQPTGDQRQSGGLYMPGSAPAQPSYQPAPVYQPLQTNMAPKAATPQPPIRPVESTPYSFDYNSYEAYHKGGQVVKKKTGVVIFVIILVACLLLGLVAISLVNIGSRNLGSVARNEPSIIDQDPDNDINTLSGEDEESSVVETSSPSKKSELIIPPSGELLTTPQVAAKVIPVVVGILRYENSYYEATGLGSGFMMKQEGNTVYVVTNAHVVDGGTNFTVKLFDDRLYDATLVGSDTEADLAVLSFQIEDKEETVVIGEMGDSDELLVGETVIAIGNPVSVELSSSVTQGIVSALNRQLSSTNNIGYIQTDAAINPGNSGGALLNMYGQVIGINSMKAAGYDIEGLGFAIPMTDALPLIEDLIGNGRITIRPVLGIQGRVITEMEALQLDCPIGIMVMETGTNDNFTPELIYEDIITHVNGKEIASLSDLKGQLEIFEVGDAVTLTVYRRISTTKSEEISVEAVLISSGK